MSNWAYVRDLPTATWRTAMSTVCEVELTRAGGKPCPTAQSVTALESLCTGRGLTRKDTDIPAGNTSLGQAAQGTSLDISVDLSPGASFFAGLKVPDNGEQYTLIDYDSQIEQFVVDRTHSGVIDFSPELPARPTAPLSSDNKGQVHLCIIVDAHSVKIFAADGILVITQIVYSERDITGVSLYAEGGTVYLGSLSPWHLGPVRDAGVLAEGPNSPGAGKPAVQGPARGQAKVAAASAGPTAAAAGKSASARFPLVRIGTFLILDVLGAAAAAIGAYTLRLRRQHP